MDDHEPRRATGSASALDAAIHETEHERLERNWNELLQELRVTQAGTQILTGFLLALAFQPAFMDLDGLQRFTYLCLVVLAAVSTITGLAPVALHRALFRRGAKESIVLTGDLLLRVTLAAISVLVTGVVFFLFDVVLDRTAAFVAGGSVFAVVIALWFVVPLLLRRSGPARVRRASAR